MYQNNKPLPEVGAKLIGNHLKQTKTLSIKLLGLQPFTVNNYI